MTQFYIFSSIALLLFGVLIHQVSRHVTRHKQCPVCGSLHPDRVQRPGWAKSIQFLIVSRAFHCHKCGNRYLQIGRATQPASTPKLMS